MKKALVTGANGFVGSHICQALLDSGFAVKGMVRQSSKLNNLEDIDIDLVYGDLTDYGSLLGAVKGVDFVINNAGLTKALDKNEFETVNKNGTENILKAVLSANKDVMRFIQISSAAACGPSDSAEPVNEDTIPKPISAYGKSKLGGESAVLDYKTKLPVTILRPSAIYGPRDKEMLSFFKAVKFRLKPTFGTGECYINFTYVKDLAKAVARVCNENGESGRIYFVAEKRRYSFSEAGDIISEVMGIKAIDIHIPSAVLRLAGKITEHIANQKKQAAIFTEEKAIELSQKFWIIDSSRISRDLGFESTTPFRKGVEETVKYYYDKGWL